VVLIATKIAHLYIHLMMANRLGNYWLTLILIDHLESLVQRKVQLVVFPVPGKRINVDYN